MATTITLEPRSSINETRTITSATDAAQILLAAVLEGTYDFTITKDGYETYNGEIVVDANKTVTVTLTSNDTEEPVDEDVVELFIDGLDMSNATLIVGTDQYVNPITKVGNTKPTGDWDIWIKE